MNTSTLPLHRPKSKPAQIERLISPLPTFWNIRGRFYGYRIDNLPQWYVSNALEWPGLRLDLRAALLAVSGLRVLANDQRGGL